MANVDYDLYEKLVTDDTEQNKDKLLENLLAYHYSQQAKFRVILRHANEFDAVPSEQYLRDIVLSSEMIKTFRKNAKENLAGQILDELKISQKKSGFWGGFLERASASLASRVAFELLAIIITQLILYYGLTTYFPTLKDVFCR